MKKIIIGFVSLFLLLIIAAFAIPYFFKDKILEAANKEVSKELKATLTIRDIDVSFLQNIKSFPDITLVVDDFILLGKMPFEGDTLVHAGKMYLALDIQSVLGGENMKINAISIDNAQINAIVNENGEANWDITKPTEDTKPSKFKMALSKLEINNTTINYLDEKSNYEANLYNITHSAKGDFSDELFDYNSETDIEKLNFWKKSVPMMKDVHFVNQSKIKVDKSSNKITLKDNHLQCNELAIILNGIVKNNDNNSTYLDIDFESKDNDFKSVLSLIPAIYQRDFNQIKTLGKFDIKGKVNGIMTETNYPKMDIAMNITNGEFQYPSLPKKVSNIQVNAVIQSPGGSMDNVVVSVPKFSMKLGTEPFEGRFKLSNMMSNPAIELYSRGNLNLSDVNSFYPLEGVKKLAGLMHLDLDIKAKQSDIQSKNYGAINASGIASIKGLEYESNSIEKPLKINNLTLNFSPKYVDVPQCNGSLGSMNFDASGKLENFIGYYMHKSEVMKGTLNFYSNKINANDFLSADDKGAKSDYVMVPKKIDFDGNIKIDEMLYGKINMKNLSGQMTMHNEQLDLKNVSANLLGGSANMSATYSTIGQTTPKSSIKYNASSFDLKEVFAQVESAQKLAPILEYMTGKISSESSLTMSLLPDMSPDLNTLNGNFLINIPFAKIINVPALKEIANVTKLSQLNNLEAQNIKANMTFVNGKAIITPFNFKAADMNIGVGGSQGLDKSIDYKMAIDVPFAKLGNASSVVSGLLTKFKIPIIGNINPETIRLNLNLKGFFNDPKVSLGVPEILAGGKAVESPMVAIQNEVKKKTDELKNQAIKTVDSIKNEVETQVKKEVEKKVDEVKQKAEEEVNKKKEDLMKELKKKLPW